MQDFIETLEAEFVNEANESIAQQQKAYLRDQFDCYGIKTPERRQIQKPFLHKSYLPPKSDLQALVKKLWAKPQRDYHYFAQELAYKYVKQLEEKDIALFEFMVLNNSWWDTVDFIAPKLMGEYFKRYPENLDVYIRKWIASENIWLQRSALLYQLKWKEKMDKERLASTIKALNGTQEFFINKAIGWMLRELSRTNPAWVQSFTEQVDLHPLSKKEALRLIK